MPDQRKRILVVNDDGIYAAGLLQLVEKLHDTNLYDVRVSAPNKEQSGVSHAITVHAKVCVEPHKFDGAISDVQAFRVSGFPADCVKVALSGKLFDDEWRPDLILSGINRGGNAALNVVYSGTVGGALEGCMNNIPSCALYPRPRPSVAPVFCCVAQMHCFSAALAYVSSLECARHCLIYVLGSLDFPPNWHKGIEYWPYDKVALHSLAIIAQLLAEPLPTGVALNVNFPNDMEKVKGYRWCKQGLSMWDERFVVETGDDGKRYFSMRGRMSMRDDSIAYDENALQQGWIAVTALGFQQNVPSSAERVASWPIFKPYEADAAEPDAKIAKVHD